MKLIILIPCYNESETLPMTVADLPKKIDGIDQVEYLVVDDGSTDNTNEIAHSVGVHHVLRSNYNQGYAKSFIIGIRHAVNLGADIVVNTDGDNQYCGQDVPKLIAPIIAQQADIVIGTRPILKHPEFSFIKKMLQIIGSWVVRKLSKVRVKDAASGFKAYSKKAALMLNVYTKFSFSIETLIQAGYLNLKVVCVDIRINVKTRPSRLFKNIAQYIYRQSCTMIKMFIIYRPGAFFSALGCFAFLLFIIVGIRYLFLIYMINQAHKSLIFHLPSLILGSIFAFIGVGSFLLAILGELIKSQRRLTEEILYLKRTENINFPNKTD